jgi:hypothetical protein
MQPSDISDAVISPFPIFIASNFMTPFDPIELPRLSVYYSMARIERSSFMQNSMIFYRLFILLPALFTDVAQFL